MTWAASTARLTGLLAGVGLATSRLGLLLHEFCGHGGVAVALGGEVSDVKLFWFAGGWVHTRAASEGAFATHATMLGGIAIELVIGIALWLSLTCAISLAGRIVRALGATFVAHGCFYLAAGTFHGFGDGVLLHRELGDARYAIAIVAGALACGAAYLGARSVLGALAATIPGSRGRRIAGMAIAVALAGGALLGSALGEVRLRRDDTYGAIMKPASVRVAEAEYARWLREQEARGVSVADGEREARMRAAAANHDFPFAIVLAVALAAAVAAGAARSRTDAEAPVTARLVLTAAGIAVGSLAAVIALDAAFH